MANSAPIRFSIHVGDEAAAVAHLESRGYSPTTIERGKEEIVLIFAPLPDDQMLKLIQSLPMHLSAKIGIVTGDQPPFAPKNTPP